MSHYQQTSVILRPGVSVETKARLALWLLMIRSRLRSLGQQIVWGRYHDNIGYSIQRPHSPVDQVLRVWMEGVAPVRGDESTLVLLRMLIDLLLHEAQKQRDYRSLFPFLIKRINVHVIRLLEQTDPVVVGEMVFVDMAVMNDLKSMKIWK